MIKKPDIDIVFREMQATDYDAVIAVWLQADNLSLREADSEENIINYLKQNAGLSFVATVDDKIIAAVLVGTDGRRGYLQHLAVLSEYQGRNIGRTLVSHSLQALKQQGIFKTHLFVLTKNEKAQGFYKKLGWVARDEVQMYSFNTSDEVNI